MKEFFNFWNQETYHFFRWVTSFGGVDVNELIRKAYDKVEQNDWIQMGMDVSTVAKDELAFILEEFFDETKFAWAEEHGLEWMLDGWHIVDHDATNYYETPDCLFLPILDGGANNIHFGIVAAAILIRAGKWAPEKGRPEAK